MKEYTSCAQAPHCALTITAIYTAPNESRELGVIIGWSASIEAKQGGVRDGRVSGAGGEKEELRRGASGRREETSKVSKIALLIFAK